MSDSEIAKSIKMAATAIRDAKAVIITAGAGMGVDSGLPDFRGPEGFWSAYPPIKKLGLSFSEVSTPTWFVDDPEFAWGFFGHRLQLYKSTTPHRGFQMLKKLAEEKPNGYFVFTSNVDGHFQKAGFSEENIVECHGSLRFLQCINGNGDIWPVPDDFVIDVDESNLKATSPLPMGPPGVAKERQVLARPNVMMFNDWQFIEERTSQQKLRFAKFMCRLKQKADPFVVIEIGAGLAVPTIRWHGESLVRDIPQGIMVRINPRDTDIPGEKHISLPFGGLEALDKIDQEIKQICFNEKKKSK